MSKIAFAKQNGDYVEVFDARGLCLFSHYGILVGYTSTTVAIKDHIGDSVTVWDENNVAQHTY